MERHGFLHASSCIRRDSVVAKHTLRNIDISTHPTGSTIQWVSLCRVAEATGAELNAKTKHQYCLRRRRRRRIRKPTINRPLLQPTPVAVAPADIFQLATLSEPLLPAHRSANRFPSGTVSGGYAASPMPATIHLSPPGRPRSGVLGAASRC